MDERRHPKTNATVDQLLGRYLDVLDVDYNTRRTYGNYIERHVRAAVLGRLPLSRVDGEGWTPSMWRSLTSGFAVQATGERALLRACRPGDEVFEQPVTACCDDSWVRLVEPVVESGTLTGQAQPELGGSLVTLRPWQGEDIDVVVDAYADSGIQLWNFQRLDRTEAAAWIESWSRAWHAETDACWAVLDPRSGEVLGRVALRSIQLAAGTAQVTYWILPEARGLGLAAAATTVAGDWALRDLGLHRLELHHSIHNPASCRVADKAGYRLEGTLLSALLHSDGWHDIHLHARTS